MTRAAAAIRFANQCTRYSLHLKHPLRQPGRCFSTRASPSAWHPTLSVLLVAAGVGLGSMLYSSHAGTVHADAKPTAHDNPHAPISQKMEEFVKRVQRNLTSALEEVEGMQRSLTPGPEGSKFKLDTWQRKEGRDTRLSWLGGYGCSAVLQGGRVFEKAGVNYSVISSPAPKPMLAQMRARKALSIQDDKEYDMLREKGSSLAAEPAESWFGGGCDLTPSYLFPEDAQHFHKTIKDVCDKHDKTYYPKFKKWCDDYFVNTHRGESRGVGGIFFDDLEGPQDKLSIYRFVSDCGDALVRQYVPIVKKRINMPFTEEQKQWQQLRRGRYVEFNLIHDRGTKFGLVTPGVRIESVLMSLPLTARWEYMHEPKAGSEEEKLLNVLKQPRSWA
ncbi:Coproporphyrinogen-III oxidase [Kappamyces sp. JEL0680]|nr:Coproporphyrinogen-III oxidase [Kappamyces sp. JEL0680]